MGVMRFAVQPPERIRPESIQRAYLAAADRTAWRCDVRAGNGGFEIERDESDSGTLHIHWHDDQRGEMCLSTATLVERVRPYLLSLELARGKLYHVRSQLADWQNIGLVVPPPLIEKLRQAQTHFSQAVVYQHDQAICAQHAEKALAEALNAADLLANSFTDQALAARHRNTAKLEVRMAAHLGCSPLPPAVAGILPSAVNAGQVNIAWRYCEPLEGQFSWQIPDAQIAWCREKSLAVLGGPLVELDYRGIPDWLALWEDDLEAMLGFVQTYTQQVVTRYRGKVDLWACAARVGAGRASRALGQAEHLQLAARVLETVSHIDQRTPTALFFDQPWAEYSSREDASHTAFDLADHLLRAGLPLKAIGLEINLAYWPIGSFLRDPLDLNRLLDQWSSLGLPLLVSVTLPSGCAPDPKGDQNVSVIGRGWNDALHKQWVERITLLLMSKLTVQGVIWSQLRDAESHRLPHGGLFDAADRPKAALNSIAALRKKHLI